MTGHDSHDAAGPRAVRVALAREIAQIALASGKNQREISELLGTTQPRVSALLAGKVEGFSLDRLVRYLNLLGDDIHIVVLPTPPEREQSRTWVIGPASRMVARGSMNA